MLTVRTEDNTLIYKIAGQTEADIKVAILHQLIPNRPINLKNESSHSAGYVVENDYTFTSGDIKLYFWKGVKLFL